MAKTPRTWTGARTPSGLKRVRQADRRHAVLQPRRSAAKTFVTKALSAATGALDGVDPAEALREAFSALDRAAKVGAIHPNAAARRKSRLTLKVNAAIGGAAVQTGGRVSKSTGKARAALSKTARSEAAASQAGTATKTKAVPAKPAAKATTAKAAASKATTTKAAGPRATTARAAGRTATAKPAAGASTDVPKAAPKPRTRKPTTKA